MSPKPARRRRKQHLRQHSFISTTPNPTLPPLRLRGGGPAVPPVPPVPPPVPPYWAPFQIPATAPHRAHTRSRQILNKDMRNIVSDLVEMHQPLYFLQFMIRSLYRRVARTMDESDLHHDDGRLRAHATSQRAILMNLRHTFSLTEAKNTITLKFVRVALVTWHEIPGVQWPGAIAFPRVFGRSERRMYGLVQRLITSYNDLYEDVGEMLRGFYSHRSPYYCGMQ